MNPALTAMANALRVGDHLLERLGARRARAEAEHVALTTAAQLHVVVVGGGFAGVGCVKRLAREDGRARDAVDRHNYHQFQPLLYQVATSQLASSDIAFSLRKLFRDHAERRGASSAR